MVTREYLADETIAAISGGDRGERERTASMEAENGGQR